MGNLLGRVSVRDIESATLRHGVFVALAIALLFFSLANPLFLTEANIRLILLQSAVIGILAVPSALLMMAGYVDFAIGSILGLLAVVGGRLLGVVDVWTALALVIAVGAAIGFGQGFMATRLRFPPLVLGLGLFTGLRGLAFVVNDGQQRSGFGESFALIGRGEWHLLLFRLEGPIGMAIVAFVVGIIFLGKTRWGAHIIAIGGNSEAARRAGISLSLLPVLLYMSTAAAAGLGAMIQSSRLNAAPPTLGDGLELSVISAVLLGGVQFGGGKGSLLGVAAGVLFIGILNNGLLFLGVSPFWLRTSSGAALVLAAALDAIRKRRIKT
ncbi:MAG: ABC transporter permease [Chloroflexi bacterium]|nr:ABC transporter permease [Chloroflexota bacterium]